MATALLVAGGLSAIWAPAVTPGLDTPMNLVAAWIASHPDAYKGWFVPNLPLTVLTHRAVLSASFLAGSPFVAMKIARSVELLSLALGSLALVRRVGSTGAVVVPLAIAAGFGWFHLMGYLNFAFALALCPWALACLAGRGTRRETMLLALALLVITETHAFVGAGLATIIVAAALCHRFADRGSWRGAVLAALPSFLVVAATVVVTAAAQPDFETKSRRTTTFVQDLMALPNTVFGGYSPLGAPLAALAAATAVLWLWEERRARTLRWWVGLLSLATIALYFVAPLDAAGWLFLKPRFAAFPLFVAALPARLPSRWAKGLGAIAVTLAAAHVALFGVRSARAGGRVAQTIASFGHEAPGVMLPVVFDGHDGEEPSGNLGALTYAYAYALLQGGGAAPLFFAHNPGMHHVLFAPGVAQRIPKIPNPWAGRWLTHAELADEAALASCAADSVVLIGATDEDRARLEARGIRFSAPGFGRPSCARGVLAIDRGKAPVRIRIGLADTDSWAFDGVIEEPLAAVDAALPAGPVDVVLCAPDERPCRPGGHTLAERRFVVTPGETFRESIAAP